MIRTMLTTLVFTINTILFRQITTNHFAIVKKSDFFFGLRLIDRFI